MRNKLLSRLSDLESKYQISFPIGGIAFQLADETWKITFSACTELSGIYTDDEKLFLELRPDIEILSYIG